jgi:outer membrane receptor protein involved in Fe transport
VPQFLKSLGLSLLAAVTFTVMFSGTQDACGQGITTGTISGTVVDPSGAAIPNAQITATSSSQGLTREAKCNASGLFSLYAVPIGQYTITIAAPGFSNATVNNVQVNAGATSNLNEVKLALSATATQVEVSGETAALLQTTDSQVTTTFSTQQIQSIPLNNGFDTVAEVIPGVTSTKGDNFSNTNGDNYSVNGQSGRYNNSEIDGQSNNDNSIGGPQIFFGNQDAIQEVQVITNDFSAQYGRNAGAVINYITKSGSNQFHGSGFEFYQGQFLSSLTNFEKSPVFGNCSPGQNPNTTGCTPTSLPRYVENRYGGTLGGPILKDKLFFFGSTYWDHVRPGATPITTLPYLTPTPNGLNQLASAFPNNPQVAALTNYGPYSVKAGSPTPVGIVDETVTGPNGAPQTVEFGGVSRSLAAPFNDQEDLGRLDFQLTAKDHLFVRYFYQNQLSTVIGAGENGQIANGDWVNAPDTAQSVGGDWEHIFSNFLVNQLRYSFQQTKLYFQGGSYPNCAATNLGGCPSQVNFLGTNDDSPFGVYLVFPQGRTVKVTQVQDNATWTRGHHTLLFGGEYGYQNSPNVGLFYYNGQLNYQNLSDFIQNGSSGDAYGIFANGNPVIPFTENDYALYLQDDWKVSPTFTAHIGMRWEYFGQAVNRLHSETVARESNPSTAIWSTELPLSARTTPEIQNFYKGFQPRLGFAWNPTFDKKLVVKAGYAIDENPAYYNLFLLAASGAPVVNFGLVPCVPGATCVPSGGSLSGSAVRALNLPSLPTGGDPRALLESYFPTNFRPPYVQTYTMGIDRQIGNSMVFEARYVGTKTTHDFQSVNYNPFLLNVATAFPNVVSASSLCQDPTANGYGRPDCNYSLESFITNGAWANYNGLLLNLTTQNYHGLTMTASYTRSKNLSNTTDGFRSTGSAGSTIAYPQNPLNPSEGERGLSGNDFPNVVGIGFTYQLPKFINEGLFSRLTNGFTFAGLYRYTSGQVYTPFQGITVDSNTGDSSFCDGAFNAQTVGADTCRLAVSNPKAPVGSVAYLNPYTGPQDTNGNPTLGTPQWVRYNTDGLDPNTGVYNPGTPINPSSARWIVDNQAYALSVGNPYPGAARSLTRGPSFSDLDASIFKDTAITERVKLQLSLSAYNALNQMYLGPGNANVGSSAFTENQFNSSTTPGSVPGNVSGTRFFILGAKIIF